MAKPLKVLDLNGSMGIDPSCAQQVGSCAHARLAFLQAGTM